MECERCRRLVVGKCYGIPGGGPKWKFVLSILAAIVHLGGGNGGEIKPKMPDRPEWARPVGSRAVKRLMPKVCCVGAYLPSPKMLDLWTLWLLLFRVGGGSGL